MIRKEKLEELKSLIEQLKTVEVIKREIEEKDKFLKSEAYYFKLNNGIIIPREKLIKGSCDGSAVIVMPVLETKEVLTVIEPRVFTSLTVGVGFPAGYVESHKNETIKHAAKRELFEETGYATEKPLIDVDSFYQDEGCSSALNHLFIAKNCFKKSGQHLDSDEVVRYMLFNYEELFELENLGYIKGSNSKLLLEKSKKYMEV